MARIALLNLLISVLASGCSAPIGGVPDQNPPASSGSARARYRVVTIVEGLEHPWGMAFLPGNEGILVTERPGRLRLVRDSRLDPKHVAGLPEIRGRGEGGLLDVALHPAFAQNRLVYLAYSKPGARGGTTALARGRLENGRLVGVEDVFVAEAWEASEVNYGGRIVFDREGHLFLTVGDRRDMERSQDLRDHVGTTIRLHEDGRVPIDNPFVGRAGARPEIFTYGNRNAQGLAVHPATGDIWQIDHGPFGGDRIDRILPGRNYGWPRVSFGDHYDGRRIPDPRPGDGTEPPIHHWNPGISPSGLTIYDGHAFPHWKGDLFVGSLKRRCLNRLRFDGTTVVEQEQLLQDRNERIRTVVTGADGFLYLLVDAPNAPMLRLEPAVD
jgi:glucose/arabinose dehydrogenase